MLCSTQNPKLNKQFASGFAVASLSIRRSVGMQYSAMALYREP
mgnify:CR=1 FL=1